MFSFKESIDVPKNIFLGGRFNNINYEPNARSMDFIVEKNNPLSIKSNSIEINVPITINDDLTVVGNITSNSLSVTADVSISGDLTVGGQTLFVDSSADFVGINTITPSVALDVSGDADISGNADISGDVGISGSTNISGSVTVAGDLGVSSDANIYGDAIIEGDLTVRGLLTSFNVDNVVIEDSLIKQALGNTGDIVDIGHYGLYNDGVSRYAGLFRDASDGIFKFFKGTTGEPDSTVDISNPAFQFADVQMMGITAGSINIGVTQLITDPNTGNVGVGITVPAYHLDVSGDINFRGNLFQDGATITSLWIAEADDIYPNNPGSVGIGTTTPAAKLHVSGDGIFNSDLTVTGDLNISGDTFIESDLTVTGTAVMTGISLDGGANTFVRFRNDTSGSADTDGVMMSLQASTFFVQNQEIGNINLQAGNDISLRPGDTETFRADANGNVAIGSFTPTVNLAIGDANTGLNQEAEDELAIYTGGTQRAKITDDLFTTEVDIIMNSNDLNISSGDSFNGNLHINCGGGEGIVLRRTLAGVVEVGDITNNNNSVQFKAAGDHIFGLSTTGDLKMNGDAKIIGSNNVSLIIEAQGNNNSEGLFLRNVPDTESGGTTINAEIQIREDDIITLSTGTTERMRIDANGDVGIGITNPEFLLHIRKDQDAETRFEVENQGTGTAASVAIRAQGDSGAISMEVFDDGYTTNGAEIADSGLLTTGTGCDGGLGIRADSTAGDIHFWTGGDNERMRILSTGEVGIGLNNPQTNVEIEDTGPILRFTDDRSSISAEGVDIGILSFFSREASLIPGPDYAPIAEIAVRTDNTTTSPDGRIDFSTGFNGTLDTHMRIRALGDVVYYSDQISPTTVMATYRKGVTDLSDNRFIDFEHAASDIGTAGTSVGGIRIDGGGTLVIDSTSSIKLKENIRENKDESYNIVKNLRGVKFDWRSGLAHDVDGFIAEEVKEIYPNASGCINGYNTVSTATLVPILWSALRKTMDRIDELEEVTKVCKMIDERYKKITLKEIDTEIYKDYQTTSLKETRKLEKTHNTNDDTGSIIYMADKVYKKINGKYERIK